MQSYGSWMGWGNGLNRGSAVDRILRMNVIGKATDWQARRLRILLIALTLFVAGCFWFFRGLRDAAQLSACRPRFNSWITEPYAKDHGGMFPPLSPTPGRLAIVEGSEVPYVGPNAANQFICEQDSNQDWDASKIPGAPFDDWSYVYLGYVIENQTQLEAFEVAYRSIIASGGDFNSDIKVGAGKGNCGTDTLYRLRSANKLVETLPCLAGSLEVIPLVIEWPENHHGRLAKVGFMVPEPAVGPDGKPLSLSIKEKVMKYPGEWPMTEAAIGILRELDGLGKTANKSTGQ